MAHTNRIFTYTSLILLSMLVLAGGYYFFDKYGKSGLSPLDAIPANSSLFIKINEPGQLIEHFSGRNDIWQELAGTRTPGRYFTLAVKADSLLREMAYHEWLDEGQLYLAVAGHEACFIFSLPYGADENDILELLKGMTGEPAGTGDMSFRDMDGHVLSYSDSTRICFAVKKGLCMIGTGPAILEGCAQRIKNKEPLPSSGIFRKVASTAGRNVHANIYINFRQITGLEKGLFSGTFLMRQKILPEFGSWAEIDMLVKNDEILLNGYTETADSLHQFLGLFEDQAPQKVEITRILPYNTSMLLHLGFEDFNLFYEQYSEFMGHEEVYPDRTAELNAMKKRLGPALEDYMTSWIGNEIALASINPHLDDPANNSFVAVHARDIEMAMSRLRSLGGGGAAYDYRGYGIRQIPARGLLKVMFGRIFSVIEDNFYTRIEDYIVFANSGKSLENFINIFLSGKTLEQNANFKSFTDNVSDKSNLFCYLSIRNSAVMLENVLSEPLARFVADNPEAVANFEALAVQFKALNGMFFTSAYVKHNPAYIKEDLSIWKAYLDAPVYGRPYFVKDHRTNHLKIVCFDTTNNMYLIDHEGNISWKLNIGEKVISDVHTVDYYRNGKIQYLFNTRNHLYLIDLLGRDVEGYPVSLKGKATNGLAVFDYENKKDYRIMLALDDNRIYNYNIEGELVKGWKKPLSKGVVKVPVQHLRVDGKDYILIADSEGNIKITNRKGNPRINLKFTLSNGIRSAYYVNETNSKGIILSTDASGRLTYIKANGNIDHTDFGAFSPDHYFLYEDFDNKGGKDFIYLDKNVLTVFDRFKKVIFSHEFENEIHSSPVIIPVSSREKLIGVVSEESGKIYLFDREGKLLSTPDHVGRAGMLIGSLNRDGQLNLISASGNTVYNYYFR